LQPWCYIVCYLVSRLQSCNKLDSTWRPALHEYFLILYQNSYHSSFVVRIRVADCRSLGETCFQHRWYCLATGYVAGRRHRSANRRSRRQMAPLLSRRTTSGQTPNMASDDRQELPVNWRNRGSTYGNGRLSGLKWFLAWLIVKVVS